MQIINWRLKATEQLKKHSITSAALDAEVLLSFVLKKSKEYILSSPKIELTEKQMERLKGLISRRNKGEPIAYLTNNKEFYGLEFYVDENVLVPRPETELLIETVLQNVEKQSSLIIADIGTGSGCIAITLAKYLPNISILATDISESAILVAKKNAENHSVINRIKFMQGNLLNVLDNPVDIIIANLPYLPKSEYKKEISFEPKQALFGDNNGMEYLETIIKQAPLKLNKDGIMLLEIHPPQSIQVKKIAKEAFPNATIQIKEDLAKKDRFIIIKR